MSDKVSTEDDASRAEHGLNVQPAPVHNDLPSAHDLVSEDFGWIGYPQATRDSYDGVMVVFEALCDRLDVDPAEMMKQRKQFGLSKYGTLLQPHNGRNHLHDALDELADALVYFRCAIYEAGNERCRDGHTWLPQVPGERNTCRFCGYQGVVFNG